MLAAELPVSRETAERLEAFAEVLVHWNRTVNLVSPASERELMTRHVLDSLQLASLAERLPSAADVGSGAGFPGLVLSIATNVPFLLVESDRRKAAFLLEAVRVTAAPARVVIDRVERLRCPVSLVTARAFSSLRILLDRASGLIQPSTTVAVLKGGNPDREIAEAQRHWTMQIEVRQSQLRLGSSVVILSNVRSRAHPA